jgi:putative RNA-binding protein
MVLRKHLTGGTIKKIYMNGLERIIYIDVDCYNDFNDLVTKTIVIELMGKHSNVILLNSDNTIIDSLRHLDKLDNSLRDILPGYKYSVLDSSKQDFTTSTFDDFYKILQNAESIATALSNYYTGFSKAGISYILSDLDINTEKISLDDYKRLYKYLKDIISGNPLLCYKIDGKKDDFYVKLQNSDNFQVNFFIDDFYFGKEEKEKFSSYQNDLLRLILNRLKRLEDKLSTANQSLNECSKMEDYRLYGELITANLYRIQNYNQTSITLENYYKNNEPIDIKLDGSISPSANAKKFFKKYKKLQNTYSIVQKQKELITAEIEYLDSIVYEINNCQTLQDLESVYSEISESLDLKINDKNTPKKNEKVNSSMPTELTIDGFTILVGKNNKQNDYLTCRIAKSSDLWFHTKDIHGSHVVLKLNKNKSATDSIIYKCATIAAYYSKAKLSQNVPVDYTYIKYVRKPNGAKPGMVIYTNNKTLYVNPKKP